MTSGDDHIAIVRTIIDANRYMTLATADAHGRPWAAPLFFASADHFHFYWVSAPQALHSQNLLACPEVGIVIFTSEVLPGSGQAVYMTATARELAPPELEHALTIYPGTAARAGRQLSLGELQEPNPYRMYRAVVTEHSILCPRDTGPCPAHGLAFDHRTTVAIRRT